jgi:CO dehydrogenase maturation factor
MTKKIVSTGRGGVGKSTFVALAARYLHPPLLLIDLDPDQCLPEMVGVDLGRTKVATVSSASSKTWARVHSKGHTLCCK